MKVLAANCSDLEGAKQMLAPLNGLFPRLRQVWGDSHYGGSLVGWLGEHLGWTVEAVRPPGGRLGNTGAASVPLAFAEAEATGRLRPGTRVLSVAFGAGATWGGFVMEWTSSPL